MSSSPLLGKSHIAGGVSSLERWWEAAEMSLRQSYYLMRKKGRKKPPWWPNNG
jgi:hypothetical protein